MSTRYCPSCRDERPVEQPPCPDGHADCPEWACVECGTVFVAGWLAVDVPERQARRLTTAA
jgi:hypothetical protein